MIGYIEGGYIGIMEHEMETTICRVYVGVVLGLHRDNGKEQ